MFACGLLTCVILLQGCSAKAPSYKDNWSEARNLANAGGLMMGIKDRPASEAKAPYSGPGVGLGDLIAIANVGVGAFEGGVLGMGGAGSAAFNAAHGVWATSSSDHWSQTRFFAFIPVKDAGTQEEARNLLENQLLSQSKVLLNGMGFEVNELEPVPVNKAYLHQFALSNDDYGCSLEKKNCVFSTYLRPAKDFVRHKKPEFMGSGQEEEAWCIFRPPVNTHSGLS